MSKRGETATKASPDAILNWNKKSHVPLMPIFEALNNSIEATRNSDGTQIIAPEITLSFYYDGTDENDKNLSGVEICDNGAGFTSENLERFEIFGERTKGFKNNGTGRIQFLHFFESLKVKSKYKENSIKYISFEFDKSLRIKNKSEDTFYINSDTGSIISLNRFKGSKKESLLYSDLTSEKIKNIILRQFILKLHLENNINTISVPSITIKTFYNGTERSTAIISKDDIIEPIKIGSFNVKNKKIERDQDNAETFRWVDDEDNVEEIQYANFKLDADKADKNEIWLCNKDTLVEKVSSKEIKAKDDFDGHYYLTAIYGGILNEKDNVTDSADQFTFPNKPEIERLLREESLFSDKESYFFKEILIQKIRSEIPNIFEDIYTEKESFDEKVSEIAKSLGISETIKDEVSFGLSDTEETITNKLLRREADVLTPRLVTINQKFKELIQLTPIADDYQHELETRSKELLELIPQQNMEELSRYIIRREMVADILGKILDKELDYQTTKSEGNKKPEALVHDLIFKQRSDNTNRLNDLWILDEQYQYFEGCSDLELKQINLRNGQPLMNEIPLDTMEKYGELLKDSGNIHGKKPDIYLYPEEGKCILIELKAPDVDLMSHLGQLTKYTNILANFSSVKFDNFYCYLIGEKTDVMGVDGDYIKNINGDYVRPSLPVMSFTEQDKIIAHRYTEVTKLSSLRDRAIRRNRSFAEKLDLRYKPKDVTEETKE